MSGAGGPKTPAELKEAGTALYKAGEFAKAGGKYAAALELLPPAPASAEDEDMRQKLRLNLAQCYIKLSSFRAAEALCDAVLAADPNCAKALFRRGQARLGRDALPEALADLLAACKLDPKSRELRTEYDELKKLTTTHPTLANRLDDLRVVEEKALRQLHTGRTDEALRTFGLIQRECDSDSVEVQLPHWEARAALGTGSGHLHAGRRAEARAAFERALDRAVSEHARAPVLAVYATIALCLLASDAPGGAHSDQAEQARAQLASALVAAEGLGDGLLSAAAHGAMACALLRADDPRAALSHARAAVQRSAAECDEHGKAIDLITLAAVERRLAAVGGPAPSAEGANAQLARALEIARALKYARVEAEALSGLARLRLSEGRASEASEFGAEAVRLARAYQLPVLEVGALASLGCASLALAERRLAPPEGVDVPAAADLFARAAALALGGQSGDGTDGGRSGGEGADERLALLLRANAHGAALQHAAAAPPGAPRDALVCGVRKDLVADIAEARELDCLEVERMCLGHLAVASLLSADMLPAIECLETALSLGDGEYAGRDDHFSNLGVVHAALGAHSQAAAFFQKAVDSARLRGVGGWKSACHSGRLGMALAANGEHEAAYSALLEAVNELGGATRAAAMLSLAAEAQAAGRSADGAKFLEQAFLLLRYGRDTVPSADADAAPAATE